ncbi:MAG TPA: NAD-dependent protein deacylase [Cycloclasticus sp.]|jgi:NAD-dependent deacetylase|nr:NAD-dependent protein deacylase [Cycloclasticus sp.]HIL91412.1 NAD-dependent protein deacylase [Cycloclasticus sp.]
MSKYKSIVILTGAGISAESGIKTFRASDGLWEDHRIEDVATPEGFERDPELVHRFYNMRREQLLSDEIKPNKAHIALASLEQNEQFEVLVVTQNIDNLHERAGTKNIIHMHGELLKCFCVRTQKHFTAPKVLDGATKCECCQQPNTLRPDIVWFGEMPYQMDEIYDAISRCDLFLSIGTSGNVYPAAGFVQAANQSGAHTVELNLEPSLVESEFKETIYGNATDIVGVYLDSLTLG